MRVGVLALQGDFAEHIRALKSCGAEAFEVRTMRDLEDADALVMPGGESTTIIKLLDRFELRDGLKKKISSGMPVFATCAGSIALARKVSDGEEPLALLDVSVLRNAYGRQRESYEAEVDVKGLQGGPLKAVFIRAPAFEETGPEVEILAEWAGRPVAVREGNILAIAFHPELTEDRRLHKYFLDELCLTRMQEKVDS